ncbi:hypothetical protein [Burkholderia cenocepacia]|uniref:hypothetical protein n=1 Tax=Burkholderia cenocepacia TaxID=95486 RepID=UPI0015E81617|nr:hypothetical protein [Burkholderia cenocepacia]
MRIAQFQSLSRGPCYSRSCRSPRLEREWFLNEQREGARERPCAKPYATRSRLRALTLKLFDLGKQVVRSGFEHALVVPLGSVTDVLESHAPILRIADYGSGRELAPLFFEDLNCVTYMIKFFFDCVVPVHTCPEYVFLAMVPRRLDDAFDLAQKTDSG